MSLSRPSCRLGWLCTLTARSMITCFIPKTHEVTQVTLTCFPFLSVSLLLPYRRHSSSSRWTKLIMRYYLPASARTNCCRPPSPLPSNHIASNLRYPVMCRMSQPSDGVEGGVRCAGYGRQAEKYWIVQHNAAVLSLFAQYLIIMIIMIMIISRLCSVNISVDFLGRKVFVSGARPIPPTHTHIHHNPPIYNVPCEQVPVFLAVSLDHGGDAGALGVGIEGVAMYRRCNISIFSAFAMAGEIR